MRLGVMAACIGVLFTANGLYRHFSPLSDEHQIDHIAKAEANSVLEAGLDDPTMQLAYAQLDAEGALRLNLADEANMTFRSPSGNVVLTRSDIRKLNTRYRAMSAAAARQLALDDAQPERHNDSNWGDDTVY